MINAKDQIIDNWRKYYKFRYRISGEFSDSEVLEQLAIEKDKGQLDDWMNRAMNFTNDKISSFRDIETTKYFLHKEMEISNGELTIWQEEWVLKAMEKHLLFFLCEQRKEMDDEFDKIKKRLLATIEEYKKGKFLCSEHSSTYYDCEVCGCPKCNKGN